MQPEHMNELESAIVPLRTQDSGTSDAVLVAQAQRGSIAAFEQLVERYEARVLRRARQIAYSREDAEEIMQDAFVKAFKNLSQFRGDSRFYTWLVRITINEALMKLRTRRPGMVSIDDPVASEEDRTPPRQIEDSGPTPEQRYSQRELRDILSTTISQLAPRYRVVFHLRDVHGFSTKQTARVLAVSQAVVKSRLIRARQKLRGSLRHMLPIWVHPRRVGQSR
jgi:RNA polymerase sigma-70 factor (ECF subfamily)